MSLRFGLALSQGLGLFQEPVSLEGVGQRLAARARQLVVLARGARLGLRDARLLPLGREVPRFIEAAQDGIHGAARHAGDVDDVEPVAVAVGDRLQDDRRRIGEESFSHG